MAEQSLTQSQRVRAARAVRRWFGAPSIDALFGAQGREEAVERLLANYPQVGAENVQDGLDLLAARRDDRATRGVERIGKALAWGRNGFFLAFLLYAVALVVGGLLTSGSGDSDQIFDGLAAQLAVGTGTLVVPMLVLLGLGILLFWCAGSWRHVIGLVEVRHAVRWAVDRPGQDTRGIPLVAPFRGFAPWLVGPAVVSWVVGGFVLLVAVWMMSAPGEEQVWDLWLTVLALGLLGWALLRAWAALKRATQVANDHLLLLREREYALWVDPATALAERYLLLSEGAFKSTSA